MSLRILITGSDRTDRMATCSERWHRWATSSPVRAINWISSDPDATAKFVHEVAPAVVVNAAAYTPVDKAESEPELAHTVNAVTPGRIARELAQSRGLMVHYSTDYIFDGAKSAPYEEDRPDWSAQHLRAN